MERMRSLIFTISFVFMAWACTNAFAGAVSDGNSLYRAGRYDDAILKYGDAQGKDLDPAVVHFNVGDAQFRKNKFDEAASAFERALTAREPLLEAKAHYNLGNCKYRLGRLPEALEAYKKTIELLSGDEELDAEGKKVLADAQANYEFVQNKIKEESKASQPQDKDKNKDKQKQQQPQGGGQDKDKQQAKGDQKQDQQPKSGKDQQKEQAGQEQKNKEKEQQAQGQQQKDSDKKEKEKQAQAAESKEKNDEQKQEKQPGQAQAQKDKKEGKDEKQDKTQAQAQPVQMSKEEAGRILDSFGQFEDRQKIQDRFNANEPRPAKDW